jgi:GWxTD domain-containing protein
VRAPFLFILVFAVLSGGFPSPSGSQPPKEIGFTLGAHAFLDPERRPSVLVSVEIPYSNLVFLKKGGGFASEYVAYIKILDRKRKIVETAVVTQVVQSEEYESTRSARLRSKASQRFHLPQGDYIVECVVEVKDTQRVFKQETGVQVPDFLDTGIGVAKPRLYAVRADTSMGSLVVEADSARAWEAEEVDGAFFIAVDRHPMVTFEVYAEEETSDSVGCEVYFQVVDDKKEVRAYGRSRVGIAGLKRGVSVHMDVDDWDPGSYVFVAKAVQPERSRETASSLTFVLAYTKAMLTRHFEKTLALLTLIAPAEEVAELKDAAETDRPRVWASFWSRRDPTYGTEENEALEEHLRRVRYAEDNFGDAGGAGWESDRGKVYIQHGEPEHTELKIDPQYQGEYLIWYYYRENLRFVFYDQFGLGEYRLTNTGPP